MLTSIAPFPVSIVEEVIPEETLSVPVIEVLSTKEINPLPESSTRNPVVLPPIVSVFKSVVPIDAFVESRAILPERVAI